MYSPVVQPRFYKIRTKKQHTGVVLDAADEEMQRLFSSFVTKVKFVFLFDIDCERGSYSLKVSAMTQTLLTQTDHISVAFLATWCFQFVCYKWENIWFGQVRKNFNSTGALKDYICYENIVNSSSFTMCLYCLMRHGFIMELYWSFKENLIALKWVYFQI